MAGVADEDEVLGLEDADVVTKYKLAGEIANKVLRTVVAACKEGATVLSVCKLGDDEIVKATAAVFNKKVEGQVVSKGVAFPTCVSLNHCVCHFSPLTEDPDILLKNGDLVKIDLGVHVDGYIAPVATSFVIGATPENPATGKHADAVLAAYTAAEVALRMIKPGGKTSDITKAMNEVTKEFGCVVVEGMYSHQLQRNMIDGDKDNAKIILAANKEETKKDHKESEFAVNEVYALDVFATTGEGKTKGGEQRTTVYKKTENMYQLKLKASRTLISEVLKKFTTMPFSLRACEDEKKAKLGVTECVSHGVLKPFDIHWETEGSSVAQFKMLVLVMPNGTTRATWADFDPTCYKSEHSLQNEEYKKLLSVAVGSKNKKRKPNKNKKKEGGEKAPEDKAEDKAAESK
eukprot:m.20929 g.20929  ORF g.20929 m.20929 type:complete len:404 (-) comp10635_c0_seq2:118-1329(-)